MDYAIFMIRIVLGVTMIGHGTQKLLGWFGGNGFTKTATFLESLGAKPGTLMALAAGLSESFGGLFFAFGFLTPLACILIIIPMIAAILTVSGKNGYWITQNGSEYNILIIAVALAVFISGPGVFSVDQMIFS